MDTLEAVVHIGEKLKQLRIEQAMTQEELAQAAGITRNTVHRLESNTTEPRPPTLRKLAQALGVKPRELVRRSDRNA
jgi:transcriptional regulator with XRE-family HTH domain